MTESSIGDPGNPTSWNEAVQIGKESAVRYNLIPELSSQESKNYLQEMNNEPVRIFEPNDAQSVRY